MTLKVTLAHVVKISVTLFIDNWPIQDSTQLDDHTSTSINNNIIISGLIFHFFDLFVSSCFQIRETPDYKIWQDTMDAEFGGGKFKRLFKGPMWSVLDRKDIGDPRKVNTV